MTSSDQVSTELSTGEPADASRDEGRIEREQVEEVFGLTGGELAAAPWSARDEAEATHTFAYWYEGPPSYAARDFTDRHDVDHRTVIGCWLFSAPPAALEDDDNRWERVASFTSSGEAECPWRQADECDERDARPCPLCDAEDGEPHGCIHLGDGWAEVVYRQAVVGDEA